MKKKLGLFGLVVLVAASGFAMPGCGGNGAGPAEAALSGTWRATELIINTGNPALDAFTLGMMEVYILDNGNWKNESGTIRGTYRVSGSSLVFTQTHRRCLDTNDDWTAEQGSFEMVVSGDTFRGTALFGNGIWTRQ